MVEGELEGVILCLTIGNYTWSVFIALVPASISMPVAIQRLAGKVQNGNTG